MIILWWSLNFFFRGVYIYNAYVFTPFAMKSLKSSDATKTMKIMKSSTNKSGAKLLTSASQGWIIKKKKKL